MYYIMSFSAVPHKRKYYFHHIILEVKPMHKRNVTYNFKAIILLCDEKL